MADLRKYTTEEVLSKVLNSGEDALKVDIDNVTITGNQLTVELDEANDSVLIYGNTVKDGSGTSYVPLLDADGHVQVDVLSTTMVAGDGADMLFDSDGDNTAQVIKAATGSLYSIEVSNSNSADAWIQFFNVAAGSVTVGTTVPDQSYFVPANGAMDKVFSTPIAFDTAITYACTTSATGNGDPTTGLIVNAVYK